MTPHLAAVLNTGEPVESPSNELLDLVLMVAESAWQAKDYVASKRAATLALDLDRDNTAAWNRLGRIALIERNFALAAGVFHVAWDLAKDPATAVNRAIALGKQKDFHLALSWCDAATQVRADFLPAHIHKAAILEEIGEVAAAQKAVTDALQIFPGNSELLYALSLYQLKRGDFDNGWANYEHRAPRLELARKLDEYPEWQGEGFSQGHVWESGSTYCAKLGTSPQCAANGKTILVCGEQGLGDQIMFSRYVPLLQALGANVVLFTMPELARLFARCFSGVRVLASDGELKGLEPDYWVAMGSLPLRWRQFEAIDVVKTPQDGAASLPYLWMDSEAGARFRQMVANDGRLRVGLCWKGSPKHRRDEYRSMRFEDLKPLLDTPDVVFYSLQKGDTESGLLNLTDYCHDISDAAAAIAAMDVVVTVDTAMLHLAGALGGKVWGLIHRPGEWRWSSDTNCGTAWYRNAILFRQREQMKWDGTVSDVRRVLDVYRAEQKRGASRGVDLPTIPADQRCHWRFPPQNVASHLSCKYGPMSWLRNDHYVGRALDLYGEYSESEAELLRKVLNPGNVAVEAGANVGGLTLALGAIVGARGTVYAYEPQPAYYECLVANTAMPVQIHAIHAALGRDIGKATMRGIETSKVHAPGWASTAPEFEVALYHIDALRLPQCHLIKVDVDGPEHEILLGAEETIDRCRPLIYVEYDKPEAYPDMLPWLHGKGYRLYRHAAPLFNPQNHRGNPVNVFGSVISLMVLAVPQERKDLHPCDWGLERIVVES